MKTSLLKDQRGLGHVVVIALTLLVVGVIGFVGYRVTQKDKVNESASISDNSNPILANCMKVYKDNVLCQFAVNNADLDKVAYTAEDTSTDSMGQVTKFTVKNDGKGSISVSSTSGNTTLNSVNIGKTAYVQQNGSPWVKYTTNAPAPTNPTGSLKLDFSTSNTPKDKQVKYKKVGSEKCGNDTCIKYQVTDPLTPGTTFIWVNDDTYQLMRLTNKTSDGSNDFNLTYGPVTIIAPSPTITPAQAQQQAVQTDLQESHAETGGF